MNLGFKLKIGNEPTHFVERILGGLMSIGIFVDIAQIEHDLNLSLVGKYLVPEKVKLHTIRADPKNRWKVGNLIHFIINNRTPNRYHFAPLVKVVYIQRINIFPDFKHVIIYDENDNEKILNYSEIEKLSKNDGFDSIYDFWKYFDRNFYGKIIHWTNLKY